MKRLITFLVLAISINEIAAVTSPSFDCSKARTDVEKLICENSEVAKLDAIMALTFHSVHANRKAQAKWLKGRPNDIEYLKDYYIKRIKSFLADPKRINMVSAKLFQIIDVNSQTFNSLPTNSMSDTLDNQQPVLMLLGIIIDSVEKGASGIDTAYDFLIPGISACYRVGDKQYLFKWCHSRGNHNNGYYFWLLSFKNDVLTVKLLDVQTYDTQTQVLKIQKDVTACSAYYDEKTKEVIMTVNCCDVDKFSGKKLSFEIDSNKLVLTKQQGTSDYKVFEKASWPGVR